MRRSILIELQMAHAPYGCLSPVLDTYFTQNRLDVDLYRCLSDLKLTGNDLVWAAIHEASQDHQLST